MSLYIEAEAMGGDAIDLTAERMQALADQLNVGVKVKFNDVALHAVPGGKARWLELEYQRVQAKKPPEQHKMAFSHKPPVQADAP